jgi:hypothetical protein
LFHCKTGKKVSFEEMRLWMLNRGICEGTALNSTNLGRYYVNADRETSTKNVGFRLQKYEIVKKTSGQIIWKTYGGTGIVRLGMCLIIEDILFMGPTQNDQINLSKREFLAQLKLLPEWKDTKYYSPRLSLRECGSLINKPEEGKRWFEKCKGLIHNHTIRNRYKKNTELESIGSLRRRIPEARISSIFHSLAYQARASKSYILKTADAFHTSRVKKWIIIIVAFICSIILSLLSFLISCFKKNYKRSHNRKK